MIAREVINREDIPFMAKNTSTPVQFRGRELESFKSITMLKEIPILIHQYLKEVIIQIENLVAPGNVSETEGIDILNQS